MAEQFGTEDFRRFLLTEYALAPLVLINDTTPDLIVGNFHPDSVPSGTAGAGPAFGAGLR